MPQFDPTFFTPQLFWLAVTFIVLYAVMAIFVIPRIGSVLDERQRKIEDNLNRAAQLKADADLAIATYEKALAESRARAQAVIKDATEAAARQSEARQKDLSARLANEIQAAESRIALAKDAALAHIGTVAADVAGSVLTKLTGNAGDESKINSAVAGLLQERR